MPDYNHLQVMQAALNHLHAKVLDETITGEDAKDYSDTIETLKLGGHVEQVLLTELNEFLVTMETDIDALKAEIAAASTALQAQASTLDVLPKLSGIIEAGTRRRFLIQPIPSLTLRQSLNDNTNYTRGIVHASCVDDFDNGNFYVFSDYGSNTISASYTNCYARITKIDSRGQVSQYQVRTLITTANTAFSLIPTTDDTVRLVTIDTGNNSVTAGTLSLYQHMRLKNVEYSQNYDYAKFYVNSDRELLCVSGGFLVKLRHDGAVIDTNTTFVDQAAFVAWANAEGHGVLAMTAYQLQGFTPSNVSSSGTTYSSSHIQRTLVPVPYYSHFAFSTENGLERVSNFQSGNLTIASTIDYQASSNQPYSMINSMKTTLSMAPTLHSPRANFEIEVDYSQNGYVSNLTAYIPQIIGISLQHRCIVFRHAVFGYNGAAGVYMWAEGVEYGK